jgi:RecB family exonuclease
MDTALALATGLRHGLPIEAYHGDSTTISKSGLDDINQCPALYYARHLDPHRPPPPDRGGQLEGQLAHCATLEPKEFEKRYAVLPKDAPRRPTEIQRNAKVQSPSTIASIAWWDEWEANKATGLTIITSAQADVAWRQADAIHKLPELSDAFKKGEAEVSAYWTDDITGVACRCRPDWVFRLNDGSAILLDVKTFSTADPDDFARQLARKRYHVQAAYYTDGYAQASGQPVLAFVFIAMATEYPYLACAFVLDDEGLAAGRTAYRRNLGRYAACQASGKWPGYSDEIVILTLPKWAQTEE